MAMVRVGPRLRGIGGEAPVMATGTNRSRIFWREAVDQAEGIIKVPVPEAEPWSLRPTGILRSHRGASLAPMVVTDGRMVINGITEVEDQAEPFD